MGANNKNITITLQDRTVVLKKLSLGKIVKLLDHLNELPKELLTLDKLPTEDAIKTIPLAIALALPQFADVIVRATDSEKVTRDFLIDECSLDEVIDLVYNLLVVNNVAGILEKLKKIQALKPTALAQ